MIWIKLSGALVGNEWAGRERVFDESENVRFGSQVAVGQPRVDFITGTAGIGHNQTFSM